MLSPVAHGHWRFAGHDFQSADRVVRTALDAGLSTIDTADIYGIDSARGFGGAEALLGEVLAADPSLRSRVQLLTKGGIDVQRPYDSRPDYLRAALDASLERLGVERVELYQIHRPDPTVSMASLAGTLDAMVESGRVGAVGVSNFSPAQTRALLAHLDTPLATLQPEFSVLHQDPITDGTLDLADEISSTVLAWSPLAGGRVFESGRVQEFVQAIANARNMTPANVALAFTRSVGAHVVPIIGTQNPERIEDAASAMDTTLSGREFYDIVEAYRGAKMP